MVTHHLQDGQLDLEFNSSAAQLVMFNQELQLKSRMLRVTSCDQLQLAKLDFLNDTNFQILVRKFLPFATIVSLAIF